MSKPITTVTIGDDELNFAVGNADFNQFLNEQQPNNKVAPAYNFLQRTVIDADKDKFKKLVVTDNVPNGPLVMQIAGVLAMENGAGIEVAVKKSNSLPMPSSKTVTAS